MIRRLFSALSAWATQRQENLWTLASVLLGCAVWFLALDTDQRETMRAPFVLAGSGVMLAAWWGCIAARRATAKDLQKILAIRDSAAEDLAAARVLLGYSQTTLAASAALQRASTKPTPSGKGQ